MNRSGMLSVVIALLFSLAAFSPALEKAWQKSEVATPTVCNEWHDLRLYLPTDYTLAPLSNLTADEQVYVSPAGDIELVVTRGPRSADLTDDYNRRVHAGWDSLVGTVALLDKAISAEGYHLEWLTDEHLLLETAFVLDEEWIQLEAQAPLTERAALQALLHSWSVERGLRLP